LIRHHDFGPKGQAFVRKAARKFIQDRRSNRASDELYAETFGNFSLQNDEAARNILRQSLARGKGLMVRVEEELKFLQTQSQDLAGAGKSGTRSENNVGRQEALEARPSLQKCLDMKSLSRNFAASVLGVTPRTIRYLLQKKILNRAEKGRVVCDVKFSEEYQRRHGTTGM